MNNIISEVLLKFIELITIDPELSGSGQFLLCEGMALKNGRCVFNVNDLYRWVKAKGVIEHTQFRRALYQSELNTELRSMGYIIDVNHSTGHVDTSTYQLKKL